MKSKRGKPIDDDIVELAENIASDAEETIIHFGLPDNHIAFQVAQALQEERDKWQAGRRAVKIGRVK